MTRFTTTVVRAAAISLLALLAVAQDNSRLSVHRGYVVEWTADTIRLRRVDTTLETCTLDAKTWVGRVELNRETPLTAPYTDMRGEFLEIISDSNGQRSDCHARTIRLLPSVAALRKSNPVVRPTPTRSWSYDALFPRGNMTFGALVLRMDGQYLVVRTRAEPERSLLLRDDTTYMAKGSPSTREALTPNLRVFVRAGKNLDGEIEAYQIAWGDILTPE